MKNSSINIAILGAGSIGCYLGGCLLASNIQVTLFGRARLQQQIATHGLTVTDWQGRNQHLSSDMVDYRTTPEALADADLILVTVKSGQTLDAAKLIAQYASSQTVVISFQNGVRNIDLLQHQLPLHTVLRGMVPFNVFQQDDGKFHCGTEGNLSLQTTAVAMEPILQRFSAAKLPIVQYQDMEAVQWGKLIVNLNNAINALSGIPLRDQFYQLGYRQVMAAMIQEALTVLRKSGIRPARSGKVIPVALPYLFRLPTMLFSKVANAMLKIDPDARSSMYEDLQLGRLTEIDYLNGEIVRLAKQQQIPAPINTAIVDLIQAAEQQHNGSPMLSAETLKQLVTP